MTLLESLLSSFKHHKICNIFLASNKPRKFGLRVVFWPVSGHSVDSSETALATTYPVQQAKDDNLAIETEELSPRFA